jgi:Cu(I)/Ag(I) efflux system membrane fusion protein
MKVLLFLLFLLSLLPTHKAHGESESKSHQHSSPPPVTEAPLQDSYWTCSMHPQIKLPKPGRCPICGMELIPIRRQQALLDDRLPDSQPIKTELPSHLEVTPVVRRLIEAEVRLTGVLDVDETKLTHLTARFPGRIDRLFIDYTGASVKKGDHMYEIYSPELNSAQQELIQALKSNKSIHQSSSDLVKDSTVRALHAVRDKLILLGLTKEQVTAIEKSRTVQDTMVIYAPLSGAVATLNATEGMYVHTGSKIYSIADLSSLWLYLDAYESDLPWLRYHQEVSFTTRSMPGKTFKGRIAFISPFVDTATRTTRVRVNVANEGGILKPGLFVSGLVISKSYQAEKSVIPSLKGKFIGPMHPEVIRDNPGNCPICGMPLKPAEELGYITDASKVEKPLTIPVSAPLLTGTRAIVYVQNPQSKQFSMREVVLGPRSSDFYIVESGLSEGELVVSEGAFKIDADQQIRGNPSMMNP